MLAPYHEQIYCGVTRVSHWHRAYLEQDIRLPLLAPNTTPHGVGWFTGREGKLPTDLNCICGAEDGLRELLPSPFCSLYGPLYGRCPLAFTYFLPSSLLNWYPGDPASTGQNHRTLSELALIDKHPLSPSDSPVDRYTIRWYDGMVRSYPVRSGK